MPVQEIQALTTPKCGVFRFLVFQPRLSIKSEAAKKMHGFRTFNGFSQLDQLQEAYVITKHVYLLMTRSGLINSVKTSRIDSCGSVVLRQRCTTFLQLLMRGTLNELTFLIQGA